MSMVFAYSFNKNKSIAEAVDRHIIKASQDRDGCMTSQEHEDYIDRYKKSMKFEDYWDPAAFIWSHISILAKDEIENIDIWYKDYQKYHEPHLQIAKSEFISKSLYN